MTPPTIRAAAAAPKCRVCGCTEDNCDACIAKTGEPCFWCERDLCSACAPPDLVSKMRVLNIAHTAVAALSQLAQLLEPYAQPPQNELGLVVSQAIELVERLDLSEAPGQELTRWAALSAILAGEYAQLLQGCLLSIARPELGRKHLEPVAASPIPGDGAPPRIVAPDGRTAAAAAVAASTTLVDAHGRPFTSARP